MNSLTFGNIVHTPRISRPVFRTVRSCLKSRPRHFKINATHFFVRKSSNSFSNCSIGDAARPGDNLNEGLVVIIYCHTHKSEKYSKLKGAARAVWNVAFDAIRSDSLCGISARCATRRLYIQHSVRFLVVRRCRGCTRALFFSGSVYILDTQGMNIRSREKERERDRLVAPS